MFCREACFPAVICKPGGDIPKYCKVLENIQMCFSFMPMPGLSYGRQDGPGALVCCVGDFRYRGSPGRGCSQEGTVSV